MSATLTIGEQPTKASLLAITDDGGDPSLTTSYLSPPDGCAPYDYQKVDAMFAILRKRCCIAEYPAAGKKLIAILGACKLLELGKIERALFVSLGPDVDQWVEEIHEWTEGVSVHVHRGEKRKRLREIRSEYLPEFVITSYQTAAADIKHLVGKFDLIVLDEVSFIKTPKTEVKSHSRRLRALCSPTHGDQNAFFREAEGVAIPEKHDLSEYVWGLSATPLETSPMDIFALFWTLQGRYSVLGTSPNAFKMMNCKVKRFHVKVPVYSRGRKVGVRRIQQEKIVGAQPEAVPYMKEAIEEWWIRHRWETVAAHLPPLEVEPIWLDLTKQQRDRYKEISQGDLVFDFFKAKKGYDAPRTKRVEYALKHLYQMRCCDGLTSLPNQKRRESSKMTKCMELLNGELGGEKVIIFSRFHTPLNDLEEKLDEYGISHGRIDGEHEEDENTKTRLDFEKDKFSCLLITAKAGYALNLQTAHYGIAFNTLYNPKKNEQLWGRNRRRQKGVAVEDQKTVIWYHLLCRDTVEEAQWEILRERAELSKDIFGDEEDFFKTLTPEEQAEIIEHGLGAAA